MIVALLLYIPLCLPWLCGLSTNEQEELVTAQSSRTNIFYVIQNWSGRAAKPLITVHVYQAPWFCAVTWADSSPSSLPTERQCGINPEIRPFESICHFAHLLSPGTPPRWLPLRWTNVNSASAPHWQSPTVVVMHGDPARSQHERYCFHGAFHARRDRGGFWGGGLLRFWLRTRATAS